MTDASLNPWEDWNAQYLQQQDDRRKSLLADKRAPIDVLRTFGIDTAIITYDGEGDSGQIEDIFATDRENIPIDLYQISLADTALGKMDAKRSGASLRSYLEDFAWSVLSAYHDGFENSEGGYGTLTITVSSETVTLDHRDWIKDVIATLTEV